MTTVPSCVPETVGHLAAAADGTSSLDDSFWSIAAAVDTRPPAPPTAGMVVGTDPDNRATNPYTAPTTPPAARLPTAYDNSPICTTTNSSTTTSTPDNAPASSTSRSPRPHHGPAQPPPDTAVGRHPCRVPANSLFPLEG